MRYLVLSDLHSNLEALQATLGYARGLGPDRVLVLGDIVGYGPDPNAVIDLLRARSDLVAIRGNHDRVAAGLGEADDFNAVARAAAEWTRAALTPASLRYLRSLPVGPLVLAPGRLLAHGSPADEDEYLLDESGARRAFEAAPFDLCFFGHTHYPCCFLLRESRVVLQVARGSDHVTFRVEPGVRSLVNPGSLGQPRDRNPRCSFAFYDDESGEVTVHRVEYPLEVTREKILAAGLPRMLADRLRLGV
jgi:predicted phosphodiesterase